jgi:integral membrane protein
MKGSGVFRSLSWAEGSSLLLLLGVAMPLKYLLGFPLAVRIVGSLHGVLVLALLSSGLQVWLEKSLSPKVVLRVWGWSLVPFGFLVVDGLLRSNENPGDQS